MASENELALTALLEEVAKKGFCTLKPARLVQVSQAAEEAVVHMCRTVLWQTLHQHDRSSKATMQFANDHVGALFQHVKASAPLVRHELQSLAGHLQSQTSQQVIRVALKVQPCV